MVNMADPSFLILWAAPGRGAVPSPQRFSDLNYSRCRGRSLLNQGKRVEGPAPYYPKHAIFLVKANKVWYDAYRTL
jgi:hypothetical protein